MIKILETRKTYAYDEEFDGYSLQAAVCEIKIEEDGITKYVMCDWKAESPEYMAFSTTLYSLWDLKTFVIDDVDDQAYIESTGETMLSVAKAVQSRYRRLYMKAFNEVKKLIKEKGMYHLKYEEMWIIKK